MVSKGSLAQVALRALSWAFAFAIAAGVPAASVLCEASDGHVAVERAHVQGVCFAEAVRHETPADAAGASEAPPCADTLLDRSLVRQEDSPNGARVPSRSCVGCADAPGEPEATLVALDAEADDRRVLLLHARLRRTIQLQL